MVTEQEVTYEQIHSIFPDGSEILVWLWSDGSIQLAKREDASATWGPPAKGYRAKP